MVTGVMRIQIIANGRQAQAQMAQLQTQMRGMNSALAGGTIASQNFQRTFRSGYFEKWAKNLQWTGRQIEYNFTLPIAIAGAAATKWAMDVESANIRLQKVYGDTSMSHAQVERETEQLSRAFEALSNRFGVQQSDVAEIGASWAQAGAVGVGVARATQATLELMILGEMDAVEATRALIAIQSQYALNTEELSDAIATLNMIENATAVSLPDLIRVIERTGGSARAAGIDIHHLGAMVASLVPVTGNAERAGNALRTIIDRVMVPRTQARDLWESLGIQVTGEAWNSLNFMERIAIMAEEIGKLPMAQQQQIASATAGGWQVARFITLINDQKDALDEQTAARSRFLQALEASNDAEANQLQIQRELQTYLESNPQAFRILWTQLQNLLIRAIIPLVPAMLGFFSRVVDLARAFGDLSPRTQQFVLGGLALVALLGPLIRYVGAFGLLLSRLGHVFLFTYRGLSAALGGMWAFSAGLLGITAGVAESSARIWGFANSLRMVALWPVELFLRGWKKAVIGMRVALAAMSVGLVRGMAALGTLTLRGMAAIRTAILASNLGGAIFASLSRGMVLFMRWLPRIIPAILLAFSAMTSGISTMFAAMPFIVSRDMAAVAAVVSRWMTAITAFISFIGPFIPRMLVYYFMAAFSQISRLFITLPMIFGAQIPVYFAVLQREIAMLGAGIQRITAVTATAVAATWHAAIAGIPLAIRRAMAAVAISMRLATFIGPWTVLWSAIASGFAALWAAVVPMAAVAGRRIVASLAISFRMLPFVLGGYIAQIPALLARLPVLFYSVGVASSKAFLRGLLWLGRILLSWKAGIVLAVLAVATALRSQIAGAVDWLAQKFQVLPHAARNAMQGVIDVFMGAARAIFQVIKFIFNPFAGMGSSGSGQGSVTTARDVRRAAPREPEAMAHGGRVGGTGSGDKVPALLEPGEFVVDKRGNRLSEAVDFFREQGQAVAMRLGGPVLRLQGGGLVPAGGYTDPDTGLTSRGRYTDPDTGLTSRGMMMDPAAIDEMADSTANLTDEVDTQSAAVSRLERELDGARKQLDATSDALNNARESLRLWADTPIEGMRAMSDAIFENQMAQKALNLEMLRIEEAGGSIDSIQDRLRALGSDIENLYRERDDLAKSGAGSDVLGVIDRRIAAMEEEYHALENGAAGAQSEYQKLSDELEKLQRQGEILNLEESLAFDPLRRQIDQAANSMREMPFDEILANVQHYRAEVDRLTPIYDAQQAAVDRLSDAQGELASSSRNAVDIFAGLAGAEDWADVSGSLASLEEEIGSIEDFIDGVLSETERQFGEFPIFDPLKEQWDSTWASIKASLPVIIGGLVGAKAGAAIGATFGAAWAGPLGAAVGGVFGAAIGWAATQVDWGALWEGIRKFNLGAFLDNLGGSFGGFIDTISSKWHDFTRILGVELEKWAPLFEEGFAALERVGGWISDFLNWIGDLFSTEGTFLRMIWDNIWNTMSMAIGNFVQGIGQAINGFVTMVRTFFGFIFAIINGEWALAWEYAKQWVEGFANVVMGILRAFVGSILGTIQGAVEGIVNFFVWLYDTLVGHSLIPDMLNAIFALWDAFWNWVSDKVFERMEAARVWIADKIAAGKAIFDTFISTVSTSWSTFWDGIWRKVRDIIDTIHGKVSAFLGEGGTLRTLIATAVSAIGTLWNGIRSKFAKPINFVIGTVYNNGLRKLWNWVAEKVGLPPLDAMPLIEGYNKGGKVRGTGDTDTVPAWLTPGEFVVTKDGSNLTDALAYYSDKIAGASGVAKGYRYGGQVTGDTEGLDPRFYERLKKWSAAVGQPYRIGSGYRSFQEQARLYDRWRRRVPGQAPAAPPGSSMHNFGLASDGPHWGGRNPGRFGLRYPMSYEPWHVEPLEARQWSGRSGGFLANTVETVINSIIGPVRRSVEAFRQQGMVQDLFGGAAGALIDGAVQWARERVTGRVSDDGPVRPPDTAEGRHTRQSNVNTGRTMSYAAGWTGDQWLSLYQLWKGESDWNHRAFGPRTRNGRAYGIPQSLPGSKMASHGEDWRTNPATQIAWGIDYIRDKYRTPSQAYRIWQNRDPHWYDAGGLLPPGISLSENRTGRPEVVAAQGMIREEVRGVIREENVEHHEENTNNYYFGDLTFPNVKSGDDAEDFVRNLSQLVGGRPGEYS